MSNIENTKESCPNCGDHVEPDAQAGGFCGLGCAEDQQERDTAHLFEEDWRDEEY